MSANRPIWRWWLFCAALSIYFRHGWDWARRLMGWCVLPEWLGNDEETGT